MYIDRAGLGTLCRISLAKRIRAMASGFSKQDMSDGLQHLDEMMETPCKCLPLQALYALATKLPSSIMLQGNWMEVAEYLGYNRDDIDRFMEDADRMGEIPAFLMLKDWSKVEEGRSLFVLREVFRQLNREDCVLYLFEKVKEMQTMKLYVKITDNIAGEVNLITVPTNCNATVQESLDNVLPGRLTDYESREIWEARAGDFKGRHLSIERVRKSPSTESLTPLSHPDRKVSDPYNDLGVNPQNICQLDVELNISGLEAMPNMQLENSHSTEVANKRMRKEEFCMKPDLSESNPNPYSEVTDGNMVTSSSDEDISGYITMQVGSNHDLYDKDQTTPKELEWEMYNDKNIDVDNDRKAGFGVCGGPAKTARKPPCKRNWYSEFPQNKDCRFARTDVSGTENVSRENPNLHLRQFSDTKNKDKVMSVESATKYIFEGITSNAPVDKNPPVCSPGSLDQSFPSMIKAEESPEIIDVGHINIRDSADNMQLENCERNQGIIATNKNCFLHNSFPSSRLQKALREQDSMEEDPTVAREFRSSSFCSGVASRPAPSKIRPRCSTAESSSSSLFNPISLSVRHRSVCFCAINNKSSVCNQHCKETSERSDSSFVSSSTHSGHSYNRDISLGSSHRPELPPRSHQSPPVPPRMRKTSSDDLRKKNSKHNHVCSVLQGYRGWMPHVINKVMANHAMRAYKKNNGWYILWYCIEEKLLVLTCSHAEDLVHFGVYMKKNEDGKLFYWIFEDRTFNHLPSLLNFYIQHGINTVDRCIRLLKPLPVKH